MSQNRNDFSWPVTGISKENYEAFCAWFARNEISLQKRGLVIWGAGARGSIFASILRTKGFSEYLFVDSNPQIWGGCVENADVISPQTLGEHRGKMILVSPENSYEIVQQLDQQGFSRNIDYFLIETETYSTYMKEFLRPYEQEFLILGSCECMAISIHDKDHSSLEDMLFQQIGKDKVKILALNGIGMRAQYNILCAQMANGMKPQKLILQIALDTLVAKDHLFPHTQHVDLLKMLLDTQKKPSEEFREYFQVALERKQHPLMKPFGGQGNKNQIAKTKIRNYFQYYYMTKLDTDAEGLVYLAKILDKATLEGVKVLPVVLPVNYQLARQIFEGDFRVKYENNLSKVKDVITGRGVALLDLSYVLDSELFSWPEAPNASLSSQGRKVVADMICCAIKEIA